MTDTKTKIDRRRFNKPPRRVAKPKPQIDPLAGEALRGAGPIAAFLGWDERFTRNALAKGDIPGTKVGPFWVTTKRKLLERIERDDPRGEAA